MSTHKRAVRKVTRDEAIGRAAVIFAAALAELAEQERTAEKAAE